jgi:hypothetical protein
VNAHEFLTDDQEFLMDTQDIVDTWRREAVQEGIEQGGERGIKQAGEVYEALWRDAGRPPGSGGSFRGRAHARRLAAARRYPKRRRDRGGRPRSRRAS